MVDLLPDFVAANDDANNRLYLDCHFNAAGHALAARRIAEAFGR